MKCDCDSICWLACQLWWCIWAKFVIFEPSWATVPMTSRPDMSLKQFNLFLSFSSQLCLSHHSLNPRFVNSFFNVLSMFGSRPFQIAVAWFTESRTLSWLARYLDVKPSDLPSVLPCLVSDRIDVTVQLQIKLLLPFLWSQPTIGQLAPCYLQFPGHLLLPKRTSRSLLSLHPRQLISRHGLIWVDTLRGGLIVKYKTKKWLWSYPEKRKIWNSVELKKPGVNVVALFAICFLTNRRGSSLHTGHNNTYIFTYLT